jgi:transposase InsO family protein
MAWRSVDVQEQRIRFVVAASREESSISALCAEFGISRATGHVWLKRYREGGLTAVAEQSRRPLLSPRRTAASIEERVMALRRDRPDWGARKLAVLLAREGLELPAATVHRILSRRGLVRVEDRHAAALGRFEREHPNQLWQMDFKSPRGWGQPVGPLSVIDDHSRYVVALFQTGSTRSEAVREQLVQAFNGCGVPEAMLMDHGIPWWSGTSAGGWTQLTVWLMKQGVRLYLSGVRHPQTQGKVERFHGALEKARRLRGLPEPALRQRWLDDFRQDYNHVRPHEALAMRTPASLWYPSSQPYDPDPPPWHYPHGAEVHRLEKTGQLILQGRRWQIAGSLASEQVRLIRIDHRVLVFYRNTLIRELDLVSQGSTSVEPCETKYLPNV